MRMHQHLFLRKRAARLEPYPSAKLWLRVLDRLVMTVGVLGPLCTIPQIVLIYSQHQAAGVSVVSWGASALFDIPWIIYGLAHRERPIVLTYLLWLVANMMVCIGALLY